MGKLRVYCLKTLNKLSIYPLGNTPSAPSVSRLTMSAVMPSKYLPIRDASLSPFYISVCPSILKGPPLRETRRMTSVVCPLVFPVH